MRDRKREIEIYFHNQSINLIQLNFYHSIVIESTIRYCIEREREIVRRKKKTLISTRKIFKEREREREEYER